MVADTQVKAESEVSRKAVNSLILLCWLVYSSSYLGKVNYSSVINQIMAYYAVGKPEAGLAPTFLFFSYGAGAIFSGIFCKKYNLKWIVYIAIMTSGIINLLIALIDYFPMVKYLWLINGIALSVLWPSMIRLLAETLSKKYMAKASLTLGTTVAVGTLCIYVLSALFVELGWSFKCSFFFPAIVLPIVAFVWLFNMPKLLSRIEKTEEEVVVSVETTEACFGVERKLILLSILTFPFIAVATNLIKDGLITWVPSILKETYTLPDSMSIILTLALPVVAVFGNVFAVSLHKKIPDFILHCVVLFLISACLIGGVIACLTTGQFVFTLLGFTLVCLLVSSSNSVVTSVFPLFMKGKINSGRISGILNGFCYVGSTISSYGLGLIVDAWGWTKMFWFLFGVCTFICLIGAVYIIIKVSIKKQEK